jgi:hypothetical protein
MTGLPTPLRGMDRESALITEHNRTRAGAASQSSEAAWR